MNWLGAVLTVAASYFCGVILASGETERLKVYDSLIGLLTYMRRRMLAERMPLYCIFDEFEDEFLEAKGFLSVMRAGRDLIELRWSGAICVLNPDKKLKSELLHFGETLGALALDEQIKRIELLSAFLTEERGKLNALLPQRRKSIKKGPKPIRSPIWIRTKTKGSKDPGAAITPWGNTVQL